MKLFLCISLVLALIFLGPNASNAQCNFLKEFKFFHPGHKTKNHAILKGGYGIPFGFLGANIEYGINHFSFCTGLGYLYLKDASGGIGYNAGIRIYPMVFEKKIRPRLGVYYGINYAYASEDGNINARGVSISIGYEHQVTDKIYYDLDYSFLVNNTNSFRPDNRELEIIALPSIGIGVLLFSNH